MICEIDGRVLGGMQFGVLVQVLFEGGGAFLRDRRLVQVLLEVLVTVWAHYCETDGRVLGGMQFGVLAEVLLERFFARLGGWRRCCFRCW